MRSAIQTILSFLAIFIVFALAKGIGKTIGQSASKSILSGDRGIEGTDEMLAEVASEAGILERPSFHISIPVTWHRIPQEYLDAFAAQMRCNPSVNPNWAVYDSGFQKNSPQDGISPPVVLVKVDRNPRLAKSLLTHLNSMTVEQMTLTYDQAAKQLASDIREIFDASAKNIRLDRQKKMLRFLLDTQNVSGHIKTLTSIYLSEDTLYHVICTTLANIYDEDEQTLLQISDSFSVRR